ncbi:dihydroorotate dehydrogenase [Streptomyces acidicola]|uniref:dihydroorotate dehydrogenase n=1 Tax=Streptomyces acidicola TaxID=2596892 RepID=UPI00341248B9
MADLSTRLAGLTLRNPVIAASCEYTMTERGILACIDAGAGAVIAKSINEVPAAARQLDVADYTLLDSGLSRTPWETATGHETLFNRSGLAQTGVDDWMATLDRTQRYAAARGAAVIGSVTVASADGAAELAARMAEAVPAVEINIGAPHGREASAVRQLTEADGVAHYIRTVRAAVDCPVIVKLPGQASDIPGMARAAVDNGADAVAMIGRLNGFVPDLETWEPELGSWGAVGGPWMLPVSLYWLSKCYRHLSGTVPLIGTNGARGGLDVARFLLSGAHAVELASLLLLKGASALTEVLSDLNAYLDAHGVDRVSDVIGASVHRAREYGEIEPLVPARRPWPQP